MSTKNGPIQRLHNIAGLTDRDPGLLMAQFNKWRRTSDLGQVLDMDDALRACETRAAQGREMPWEIRVSVKAGIPDLPWPVVDIGSASDIWSPKDRRADPVARYKRVVPRCCASCKFLVDLPKFGSPECKRPDGPRFDGPRDEMLYHRCGLYRRGRNRAETDRVLSGA